MNKKNFLIIGLSVAILVIVIIILASGAGKENNQISPSGTNKLAVSGETPKTVTTIITANDGSQTVQELDVVNPGKALDSSDIAPESLEQIPLNDEAIIKYGPNGLETTLIEVNSGARVFLTFSATDDKQHLFSFSDPTMASVLVLFSQEEGDKSINFLAPGPGTYEYMIDNNEKGTLIVR